MNKETLSRIVEQAKNGDSSAFEKLYNEYYDKIYFFVLKNIKNPTDAEDITQDTFVKSMQKISSLDNPDSYESWLHTIAYNNCKDFFRNEKHYAHFDTEEEREAAVLEFSLNEPIMTPDDYTMNEERKRQIKNMIDGLKPDMRSALILYYYDDLSISKIADKLGISENSAKQKLFQARKKLKKRMDDLSKSGVVLSAVPVGNVLKNTIEPGYAATAVSYSPIGTTAAVAAKAAGITAAAAAVIGIPIGLNHLKDNNFGDYRNNDTISISDDLQAEISINGEALLTMSVNEALELGENNYELIYPTGLLPDEERKRDMYKCSAFPEYCFKAVYEDSDEINFINLYDGAYINDDFYIGMTYNEIIKAAETTNTPYSEIVPTNDDVGYTMSISIAEGSEWHIGFDLTDEQKKEIDSRAGHPVFDTDISDMDPVSVIGIHYAREPDGYIK